MPEAPTYAAIDLGATSGRVVTGRLRDGRVTLAEAHRFPNRPVRLPDGLHWNLLALFGEALEGLRRAGRVDGVGVDTWGVDYGLLDRDGRLLGLPYHYRDGRTAGMVERAHERVGQAELYATTGIQTLPINTVYQLLADVGTPALGRRRAARAGARPARLLALRRAGERGHERVDDRPARRSQRRLGGQLDRAPRAAAAGLRPARRRGHRARPAARPPRAGRRDRLRRREPRHRHRVRRRPGARRARGDPLERHVVAARPGAARAGARRRRARGEPDQRARRRRDDAAAQERDGHVAAGGVPPGLGRRRL